MKDDSLYRGITLFKNNIAFAWQKTARQLGVLVFRSVVHLGRNSKMGFYSAESAALYGRERFSGAMRKVSSFSN
jgi:hypothetical protein